MDTMDTFLIISVLPQIRPVFGGCLLTFRSFHAAPDLPLTVFMHTMETMDTFWAYKKTRICMVFTLHT